MAFERKNFLSVIINPSGEVSPAMPREEEFSIQQIRLAQSPSPFGNGFSALRYFSPGRPLT